MKIFIIIALILIAAKFILWFLRKYASKVGIEGRVTDSDMERIRNSAP